MTTYSNLIAPARSESERLWDMTCDTRMSLDGFVDRAQRARAEHARDCALEAWDRAIAELAAGNLTLAVAALEDARRLASEWGDDGPERAAIAAIDALRDT